MKKNPAEPEPSRRFFLQTLGAVAVARPSLLSWMLDANPKPEAAAPIAAEEEMITPFLEDSYPAINQVADFIEYFFSTRDDFQDAQFLATMIKNGQAAECAEDIDAFLTYQQDNLNGLLEHFLENDWNCMRCVQPSRAMIAKCLEAIAENGRTYQAIFLRSHQTFDELVEDFYQMSRLDEGGIATRIDYLQQQAHELFGQINQGIRSEPSLRHLVASEQSFPNFGTRYREAESSIPTDYYAQPKPAKWRERIEAAPTEFASPKR